MCRVLDDVFVATCDGAIRDRALAFGAKVIMTSAGHERASDRVAEAAQGIACGIVVMVQGDEPLIAPEMIEESVGPILNDPAVSCVNLASRIATIGEFLDLNTVKVVMDSRQNALYFSRAPIPVGQGVPFEKLALYKQVCIIPFRRAFLLEFARLSPTPLERAESIDMLRILEHGGSVRLVETRTRTRAVDTPDDLAAVEILLRDDPLVAQYAGPAGAAPS